MLLSFSWQSSPHLSSKYYLGWHIQNLLQAVFFAKLIVGFIHDHMAASHVLLKWFACKMGGGKKPKHISSPRRKKEKKKKTFKSQNKINFSKRMEIYLSCWHVGCTNLEAVSQDRLMRDGREVLHLQHCGVLLPLCLLQMVPIILTVFLDIA